MANINPYEPPEASYNPPEPDVESAAQQGPQGLGGWLILVGIGLAITPFRLGAVIFLIHVPLFTNGTWEVLTSPGSPQYHPLWAPLLIFEVLTNVAFIVTYLVVGYLFLSRSRFFPRTYITVACINLFFIIFDAWACSFVLQGDSIFDPDTTREIVRSLISAAIWIPYMLVSKRVKNTFTA
ncbi:MAG: DUF2569 domain-containing protein [Pirellulaceae bacterium]